MTEKRTLPGLGGIDYDEALADLAELKSSRHLVRDAGICICGHPMRTHIGQPGMQLCRPSKMECPCRSAEKVGEAQDTRHFLFRTSGEGRQHALARGVTKTLEAGKKFEWVEGALACKVCGSSDDLTVVSVSHIGKISIRPEKLNGFLCPEHVALAR